MTDVSRYLPELREVLREQKKAAGELEETIQKMISCEGASEKNDAPPHVLQNYTLTFEDTFGGDSVDTDKWCSKLLWGPDVTINKEEQYYVDALSPDYNGEYANPFSINADGNLLITAAPITGTKPVTQNGIEGGQRFTSGVLTARDALCFTGGYVECCIKAPCGVSGAWPATWLLNCLYHNNAASKNIKEGVPNGNDKFNPEIDFWEGVEGTFFDMECVNQAYHYFTGDRIQGDNYSRWSVGGSNFKEVDGNTGALISQFNQYESCDGTPRFALDRPCIPEMCNDFITVGVDWVPNDYIDFYINGELSNCIRGADNIITDQSMYLILNYAVGGFFPYGFTTPEGNLEISQFAPLEDYPSSLEIAYARIYTL